MSNLTEQWKKGELPSGWYWVEGSRAEGIYAYTSEYLNNIDRPADGEKIVEKVPSYEEWQAKLKENTKFKELLKRVNEHFKWVGFYDNNYVNYELCGDIKKVLGE